MKAPIYVFVAASVAAGIINLIWHDFATGWQPIQTFGDHVPGREFLAILTALWLVVAGLAVFWPRTAAFGGAALAVVYCIFGIFWLPRLYWVTRAFGFSPEHIIGVLAGAAQQVILASAAILIWAASSKDSPRKERKVRVAFWAFGIGCILFGLSHYFSSSSVATLVPKWMPLGGEFWAILTGTAFALAGIAILLRMCDLLAARLLTAMLFVFSLLVCLPWILQHPRGHEAWGGNAYNLTAAAAAWIVASWLSTTKETSSVSTA
ncbi:MAG TPA: hypothetical protein VFE36_13970 [Candidatus Baltobacteraceae bacterium]|jgi:uncharacterized membrane protein|nr:hypothetical protein [Candidatus Baltobacteraceae bacterium]